MTGPLVADAGPLIALARVDKLSLLRRLYGQVIVPTAVQRELSIERHLPGVNVLAKALDAGWIRAQPLASGQALPDIARMLGAGEAEALALCLQEDARFLLIDDAKGRAAARRCGIAVVGVAGVLLSAKARGELAAVGPVLDELSRVGYWLSDRLIAEVRTRAGEGNA